MGEPRATITGQVFQEASGGKHASQHYDGARRLSDAWPWSVVDGVTSAGGTGHAAPWHYHLATPALEKDDSEEEP